MAEAVGFEPTSPLLDYLISSQGRYDHFDTLPNLYPLTHRPESRDFGEMQERDNTYFIVFEPMKNRMITGVCKYQLPTR